LPHLPGSRLRHARLIAERFSLVGGFP
jgi:hypothetical protein